MNGNLLRSVMLKNNDRYVKDLATYLGISRTNMYAKLNNREGHNFKTSEIQKIKEKYNLTAEEINKIFFED